MIGINLLGTFSGKMKKKKADFFPCCLTAWMLYLIPFGSCGLYVDGGCFSPQDAILFSGYWNEIFHTQLQFCFHLESSHTLNYAHLAKAESLQTRTLGLEFMWSVYVGFFLFWWGFYLFFFFVFCCCC